MSRSSPNFRMTAGLMGMLALVCGASPALGADGQSTSEDRARFVSVTHSLEAEPLNPALNADRRWAMQWLADAPDISVNMCLDELGGLTKSKYPYAGDLTFQYAFSMAALINEHPEAVQDENAQQLFGLESALTAYRAILKDKPKARSPEFDALLATQAKGELPDFARKALARCSAAK